ncbi:M15 family metallopeptidase [Noviherbaspirillum denitrificans]|uniref:M15 family metallopeptidase n=1 Tax=Noviherbaspirillum denitrificans TaxID=1968433 RepID=UPI001F2F868F|nr:M15 family metallopeptidase [Noviherbaspirillum denitrificans]
MASVASVLALSGHIFLDPLHAPQLDRQQHIQATLTPEALVPPPPLPPSVFIGTERPGLESANRDWSRLDPEFVAAVLKIFARLESRGYPFALLEGYRSPERQDALADSGALVTNARAFQSKHQYGLAIDAAPLRNGRLVISEKEPWAMDAYLALGEEAERAGLTWGGRWKLKDYGHIEAAGAIRSRNRRPSVSG